MDPMIPPDAGAGAGGTEMVVIKVPKELFATVTEGLKQLTQILDAADQKASADIDGQNAADQGAGSPPPVAAASPLQGMGEELDGMRRGKRY